MSVILPPTPGYGMRLSALSVATDSYSIRMYFCVFQLPLPAIGLAQTNSGIAITFDEHFSREPY